MGPEIQCQRLRRGVYARCQNETGKCFQGASNTSWGLWEQLGAGVLAEKTWIFGTDLGSTEEREHTEQLPLALLPCKGDRLGRRSELRPSSNTKGLQCRLAGSAEQSAKGQRLCK